MHRILARVKNTDFDVNWLMWIAIVLYPLAFLSSGLNLSDEGYALTTYHAIFANPQSITHTFGTWGTNVIGGIWLLLFPNLGLWGVRLSGAIVSIITLIFIYNTLKDYMSRSLLLLGLLISWLFTYHFMVVNILGYNNISVLFFSIVIYLLNKGLRKNNNLFLFISGFILSFNVFVRLPNALGFLLVFVLALNYYIKKNVGFKTLSFQYISVFLGAFFNLMFVYIAMKSLGHYDLFIESSRYLSQTRGPSLGLFFITLDGFIRLFRDFFIVLILTLLSISILIYSRLDKLNNYIKFTIFSIFLIIFYIFYEKLGIPIGGRVASLLTGLCYFALIAEIFDYKNSAPDIRITSFLILVLFIILPIGSGAVQVNALYAVPFAFPILVSRLNKMKINFLLNMDEARFYNLKVFIVATFSLFAVTNNLAFAYDDAHNRLLLNSTINNNHLSGIYTTGKRANPLNELLNETPKYIKKGDTILVVWIAPMLYYLTDSYSYFPYPWTEIYTRQQVKDFLENKPKRGTLPVVIRYIYPFGQGRTYDDILFNFFNNFKYEKKWGNDTYEIYAPINQLNM